MAAKTGQGQLGLLYGWTRGEDFWGGPVNANIVMLDAVVHLVIKSLTYSAPPPTAQNGEAYVVAANPTGLWAGHEGKVAYLTEGAWVFYAPRYGWRARCDSLDIFIWYDGNSWINEADGSDPVNPGTVSAKYYDLHVTISDYMLEYEPIVHLPILSPLLLPKNMAGSAFDSVAASTVYAQMTVERNSVVVGTITLGIGAMAASFATVGGAAVVFAMGDRLTIRAPEVSIPEFKNFGFIIRFNVIE